LFIGRGGLKGGTFSTELGCWLGIRWENGRMGERRLLLSWAKAGKDSKGRNKATRSEGDDLGDSAARALRESCAMGGERDVGGFFDGAVIY